METGWRKTVLDARIHHVATTRSPSKLLANGRQYLDRFTNAGGYGRHRFIVKGFGNKKNHHKSQTWSRLGPPRLKGFKETI